jgi:uncharacterized protein (DUF2147 family)
MSERRFLRCILLTTFLPLLILLCAAGRTQTCDAILGEWFSPEKDGKFLMFKSNGMYYGKLIWLRDPNDAKGKLKTDSKNPDPVKAKGPMLGIIVFKDFKWDEEEKMWVDGKVYDARTGDTWSCEMSLSGNLVLEVRGYLVWSWLGKSAYFSRY